ncbi:hypothetical protein WMY93_008913 [Mugilogobius chulae]|uniref:Glycerol-3-phosphate dehydrogenase, mitochondrial n=1 Tax=Mugilogobius chulae TaxID=88201 RepID=A0AAW0PB89_9GOBI
MPVLMSGGKWTTYLSMADETLDAVVEAHQLKAEPCRTVGLMLEGGRGWTLTLYIRLVLDYGLEVEVAQHLASLCGSRAFDVAKTAHVTGQRWPIVGKRLVSEFAYIESESINVHIDENALHKILNEVDLNKNGQVEFDEFLQVCVLLADAHTPTPAYTHVS